MFFKLQRRRVAIRLPRYGYPYRGRVPSRSQSQWIKTTPKNKKAYNLLLVENYILMNKTVKKSQHYVFPL